MNTRKRENRIFDFNKNIDRGPIQETFYPWTLTLDRWKKEGLSEKITSSIYKPVNNEYEIYLSSTNTDGIYNYEKELGFDSVKRINFKVPLKHFMFEKEIIEKTDNYEIRKDIDGWIRKYFYGRRLVEEVQPVVSSKKDWLVLKEISEKKVKKFLTQENIENAYSKFVEDHKKGKYSVRLNINGFFWMPRMLMGIEEHMIAFYENPGLIKEINNYILYVYLDNLISILKVIPADIVYIQEDFSGSNGPMISPNHFEEFIGKYYKKLIPKLKQNGVKNVFVDTDGDFKVLIPQLMESGVDGFLPMDVNAGMDIVELRKDYPKLKFIGGFNKLEIAKGKQAIDKEFMRILPVVRQGGYIPGCDTKVAPYTTL